MPRASQSRAAQPNLLEVATATAPAVAAIREAVNVWREAGYKGATETTRALLNYWFFTDHRLPNRQAFAYHYFQREAIETLAVCRRGRPWGPSDRVQR
jgi:type III restriction enzyme